MSAQRYEHRVFGSNRPSSTVYDNPAVCSALQNTSRPKTQNKGFLSSLVDKLTDSSDEDDDAHAVVVFHKPGTYNIIPPKDATVCFVTATGGGQGGGGASITQYTDGSPATVSSGNGGAAGDAIIDRIIAIEDHLTVRKHKDVWSMTVTVGRGGDGGVCGHPFGGIGEPSIIEINSPCECCARSITIPGGSQITKNQGSLGVTVVGSQGTPDGGRGANSELADGGRGGTVTKKNFASGRPGGVGGAGGGGASPWGSCKTHTGGRGGHGLVRIEFA